MRVSGGARGTVTLAEFDNLILDAGLNRLGTGGVANCCQVGTGTSAPAVTDTTLQAYLVGTSTIQADSAQSYVAGPPAYVTMSRTFRFGTGVAAGNLTEVGVGWATASGSLFSRARIVDGGGSPTTISVLSDETLDVVYTLRAYVPADATGSVTLAGTSYGYTMRWAGVGSTIPNLNSLMYQGTVLPAAHRSMVQRPPFSRPRPTSPAALRYAWPNRGVWLRKQQLQAIADGNASAESGERRWNTDRLSRVLTSHRVLECVSRAVRVFGAVPKDATKVWTLNYEVSWGQAP